MWPRPSGVSSFAISSWSSQSLIATTNASWTSSRVCGSKYRVNDWLEFAARRRCKGNARISHESATWRNRPIFNGRRSCTASTTFWISIVILPPVKIGVRSRQIIASRRYGATSPHFTSSKWTRISAAALSALKSAEICSSVFSGLFRNERSVRPTSTDAPTRARVNGASHFWAREGHKLSMTKESRRLNANTSTGIFFLGRSLKRVFIPRSFWSTERRADMPPRVGLLAPSLLEISCFFASRNSSKTRLPGRGLA